MTADSKLHFDESMDNFELLCFEGLNLKLDRMSFRHVPEQLKRLKILRLCGNLDISNNALTNIPADIPTLVDFSLEMRNMDDAEHLCAVLTPTHTSVLVPHLRALRLTEFACSTLDVLLLVLRSRFDGFKSEGSGLKISRLQLFQVMVRPSLVHLSSGNVSAQFGWLVSLPVRIEIGRIIHFVKRYRRDFWEEEMSGGSRSFHYDKSSGNY